MPGVKSHSKMPGPRMISLFVETTLLAQSPALVSHVLPGGARELQAPTPNSPPAEPFSCVTPASLYNEFSFWGSPFSLFFFHLSSVRLRIFIMQQITDNLNSRNLNKLGVCRTLEVNGIIKERCPLSLLPQAHQWAR